MNGFDEIYKTKICLHFLITMITSISIVCSTVCSGTDERKHQSSASLCFVKGIHQWPMDSPHKGPVMWKMFPFDDVIMCNFPDAENLNSNSEGSWNQNPVWSKARRTCLANIVLSRLLAIWQSKGPGQKQWYWHSSLGIFWALIQYKEYILSV